MAEQVTVLLVEDEPSFVEALVVGLKREGFRVEVAYDGAEALEKFAAVRPDLVLLDVMLPRVSGIDVCRTIRAAGSRTPIIMVTAKTSEIDTVVGLEVGADDYVSKPYRLRELVARMRAVLRRTPPPDEVPEEGDVLEAGRPSARPRAPRGLPAGPGGQPPPEGVRAARATDDQRRPGPDPGDPHRPGLGPHYVGDTKTLDVHVKRLRARIEDDPAHPQRITTIRGLGYKLETGRTGSE